jgi:hypothetical protein
MRTVAGVPVHELAHSAITDGVRLVGHRRDYRALDLGRDAAVSDGWRPGYGARVMGGPRQSTSNPLVVEVGVC